MKEKETIEYLDLKHLVPFRNHPFKLRNGEEKEQLLQSIKTQGAIEPLIVRPLSESEYEVISGHRRMEICKELGMEKIPVIVRNLTDEQAVSMMVDANLHRENILPSERAFAYKMKWEAIRKQGQRTDLTSSQPATKYRSDERIANEFGIGKDTLHRYIRLTYLIPELLEMVDEGRIALTPAVELSHLTNEEQQILLNEIEYVDATPSLSQAQRLRGFSRHCRCHLCSDERGKSQPEGTDSVSKRGTAKVFSKKLYGQEYAEYHPQAAGKMAAAERTKRKGGTINGR